jgi:hypothetical protein
MYDDGLKQAADNMPKWEEAIDILHQKAGFTDKACKMATRLREEMAAAAKKLGVEPRP